MFSIRLRSKRSQLALRFFTYGIMTLATIVLTTLAIFYALGYRFNQATLTFEQGGLMQFRSTPDGATVLIDGKVVDSKTPARSNLPAGVHTVVMQRDGYREWQRTVTLAPGQLLWLNYTRFIPNSVTTTPIKTFPAVSAALASPDHRWMIVQEKADLPIFTLVDFNDEKNPIYTNYALPEAQVTRIDGKYGAFTFSEWNFGARYFLVRHQVGETVEWLRVDRTNPEAAVNLSRVFALPIGEAHFAGNNPNLIYVKTGDVLRRLDIGANTASAPLVAGVQQYMVFGDDTVAFTAARGDAATAQVVAGLFKGDKEIIAATYSAGTQAKIAYSEYYNHNYLAVYAGDGLVHVLRDPSGTTKDSTEFAAFAVTKTPQWLMFSNNGRMIVAGSDTGMTTYDLEIGRPYTSAFSFLGGAAQRPLQWLDDYYLWSDTGERLRLVEFDGINDREITTVAPGYGVNISQSGKTLFSIGKNSVTNTYFLQASQLVTNY